MRLLLDTHVLLWAALDPARLSEAARSALASKTNVRFISAVTAWELAQKARLGRLDLGGPVAAFLARQADALWLTPLPLTAAHAALVAASCPCSTATRVAACSWPRPGPKRPCS
jgi:PIN domain nuclease of toxin-antitoxin system